MCYEDAKKEQIQRITVALRRLLAEVVMEFRRGQENYFRLLRQVVQEFDADELINLADVSLIDLPEESLDVMELVLEDKRPGRLTALIRLLLGKPPAIH